MAFVSFVREEWTDSMQIDAWLKAACEDAERRGLPELKPLLENLARSTIALREAERAMRSGGDVITTPQVRHETGPIA